MSQYESMQWTMSSSLVNQTPLDHQSFRDGCGPFWNPVQARFGTCYLYLIEAVPTLVAICVVLIWGLGLLIPYRPQWTRPFIQEFEKQHQEFVFEHKNPRQWSLLLLSLFNIIGLAFSIVTIWYPETRLEALYPVLAWFLSAFLVAFIRPRTARGSLLLLYSTILVAKVIVLVDGPTRSRGEYVVAGFELVASAGAAITVLCMPFRDPRLPKDDIAPVYSNPTFELRSPEDDLTLWQFLTVSWMSPLVAVGHDRQLHDEDVWLLGYIFQHRKLHDQFRELRGSVVRRLLVANGLDLVLLTIMAIIDCFAGFASPVLLQQLLRAMEDVNAPRRAAIVYAIFTLLARLISTQLGVINLWYGRRCYERSRGEMITMLYEKTLARKIISSSNNPSSKPIVDRDPSPTPSIEIQSKGKFRGCWDSFLLTIGIGRKATPAPVEVVKEPASMGKILNLMRNDVYEVAQRFWEAQTIILRPLGVILSVVLIWNLIGWPCLIGVVTVFIGQAITAVVARYLLRWERKRRSATDVKLKQVSQFVEAIRHLRWYGWQNAWLERIMEARQHELNIRIVTSIFNMLISFINMFASGMFPVAAFYAYSGLAGQPLRIDIAFPALQLFWFLDGNLRDIPNLITVILNARVAVGRIEDFMNEPDKDEDAEEDSTRDQDVQIRDEHNIENSGVNGSLTLERSVSKDTQEEIGGASDRLAELPGSSPHRLEVRNASFAWPRGPSVLIDITLTFPIGLTVISGEVGAGKSALLQALLGELDRQKGQLIKPDEPIGFCAQTPWLQSMNIRENILFSAPYDETRYKTVLEACALTPDLANFKHGDLSNIGENGIGLSGGQRARVALARAVYSSAKILLLDDPISALDHQTAEFIVQNCFKGELMHDRVVVFVTHRLELCQHLADQFVEISHGKARVIDIEHLADDIHRITSTESNGGTANNETKEDKTQAAVPEKFMEEEHRASGGVRMRVYWEYIKSAGLKWWLILIFLLALLRIVGVAESWFLKQWGESYSQQETAISTRGLFGRLPSPEVNIKPWLIGFTLLAIAKTLSFLVSQSFMLVIVYKAGREMFRAVMDKVSHATFRFYDITPVGRLMNRLTSDINTIDGNLSMQLQAFALGFIGWFTSLVVMASVTPAFLLFSLLMTSGFVYIFSRFLPASQSLRRLEMVSLSPLMSNFGALLEGLMTVRAFCAQYRFQDRVIHVVDNFQKMDHFYWSLQSWLQYRLDIMSNSSILILTLIAIYTNVSPGLTAFALTAANQFVMATHSACRWYGKLQMDFVSVERIVELLYLDQEPAGTIDPPAWWPTLTGNITFEKVTIRYAPHLDPALSELSFQIKAGSHTAIIGRTGSGKSTIAMALLSTVLPDSGRIMIDNIDISEVNRMSLRHRVTFVAQDPVLFPGTMRQNLDPLDEYSSEECENVLQKVCGKHQWTIETPIDAGGKNLSQGQRQLIGLARTVLRRSPIVILDEATASIDLETSLHIQQILHEEMPESTIITIAHRLEAVKYAEYCIVLGKGRLLRKGPAGEILKSDGRTNHSRNGEES